jgi:hypothetical protein
LFVARGGGGCLVPEGETFQGKNTGVTLPGYIASIPPSSLFVVCCTKFTKPSFFDPFLVL